jgi:protein-tyrosine phosphatase
MEQRLSKKAYRREGANREVCGGAGVVNGIFWIEGDPPAALAIVLRPRGDDWLKDELLYLQRSGIGTLVSMLEPDEGESLGLAEERTLAEEIGLKFLSFPIPDRQVPAEVRAMSDFASELARRLRAGESIGVHCRASIGRATVAAASTLVHFGWKPLDSLAAIEAARGCMVPDTEEQRRWILNYEAAP